MIDDRIAAAYQHVTLDDSSAARIWSALEQALPPGKEDHPVKIIRKPLRVALIAALLSLLMIGTAYAAFGRPRWTGTRPGGDVAEYTDLAARGRVEKTVGYPFRAVEHFQNGYVFRKMRVAGEAIFDEAYNVLQEYDSVHLYYEKQGAPGLTVSVSPVLDLPDRGEAPAPGGTRTVEGIEVRFSRDHYRLVPEDYEKTEADLAAEAAGHYYISFGADEEAEYDFSFASFTLDGAEYTLMADGALDEETLFAMAGELIAAGPG